MEVFLKQEVKSESINNIQKEREMKELRSKEGRKKEKKKLKNGKKKTDSPVLMEIFQTWRHYTHLNQYAYVLYGKIWLQPVGTYVILLQQHKQQFLYPNI